MSKFLYGAAVQGIQSFILQSNKLRDIVGASEMVAQICTSEFAKLLGIYTTDEQLTEVMKSDANFILHAAGNIKYLFDDREKCERIVLEFPKRVLTYAPGISISQSVVEFENGKVNSFHEAVDLLEKRLRIQRNRPPRSLNLGLVGIRRSRQTGLPAIIGQKSKDPDDNFGLEFLDDATYRKRKHNNVIDLCVKAFGNDITTDMLAIKDMSDITNDKNSWIAVIHADGNGLGQIVQKVGHDPKRLKGFSEDLDSGTINAARDAYVAVKDRFNTGKIPIRPIVLSGDDFTAICRADLALDYTRSFIEAFERHTTGIIKDGEVFTIGEIKNRMTACAGIAFVKASYPYYYAYELAEELCTAAKKDAKNTESIKSGKELPQSCIMFHKVQDSYNENYQDIVRRELSPESGPSLQFGPYYLRSKKDRWTVSDLQEKTKGFLGEDGNAVKSTIRRWLSALHVDPNIAQQLLLRAKLLYNDYQGDLLREATEQKGGRVPAYDMLTIHTINNQVSK